VNASKTFGSVIQEILQSLSCGKYEAVFCKDMAYVIEDRMDILLEESLEKAKHSFIIRHPAHAVLSLYKVYTSLPNCIFDPSEAGFKQQFQLYQFVKDKLCDPCPVVVDISDVVRQPEVMMKMYCEAVGLKYKPEMISWPLDNEPPSNGVVSEGWNDRVKETTGFEKSLVIKPLPLDEDLPDIVKETIKEQMPYYESLYALRLKPKD